MKNVYVVTHPESTHHLDGLVGGWYDSGLSDRGVAHARAIAEALASRLPSPTADVEIYTSDLLRARRTAEIIAEHLGVSLIVDPDLREKSYGVAGGKPQAWLDERFIPPPEHGERMRHDEGIEGAETKWDMAVRAYAAMKRIQASAAPRQIVVSHGGTATFLLAAWVGMPIEAAGLVSFRFTSGGISLLRKDDYFHNHQVSELNDVSHLT
ncbi:histidine phosphatase family protein [Phytoactinopolyspora halotolerans]|uniref:Histidine phosphatase family protein n=1 Tax=Phytoactinopolyspora halotolerans TaxID=1981512 RepID=A0A6L9SIT1_9ACTN|nr:histidine phosphatase family protein [Phytoactinopolyspora halotolerans]NEE03980.1 histidine phosphatase family protein [Phytoactinopolyspora halotolerans]